MLFLQLAIVAFVLLSKCSLPFYVKHVDMQVGGDKLPICPRLQCHPVPAHRSRLPCTAHRYSHHHESGSRKGLLGFASFKVCVHVCTCTCTYMRIHCIYSTADILLVVLALIVLQLWLPILRSVIFIDLESILLLVSDTCLVHIQNKCTSKTMALTIKLRLATCPCIQHICYYWCLV